jgi:DDE superfamily endonuclease
MLFGSDGRKYCWRKAGQALMDVHVTPTVKYGGGSIMVWGCMTSQGIGNLCRIDGRLNAELYCKILDEDLKATISWYGLNSKDVIFQHDNDPKHTAKLTQNWLKNQKIHILDWPAQSPDMNPIEHLWDEVDRRLRKLSSYATSQSDLGDKIQDIWHGIEVEVCVKLIKTMPERINDVIKAKGGYTRW